MSVQTQGTWKPTTGGILSIIAGSIGIITAFDLLVRHAPVRSILLLLLGIVAIIGGVFALKRKVWGLALTGAICALFNWAGVLGILAIIFVAIARD